MKCSRRNATVAVVESDKETKESSKVESSKSSLSPEKLHFLQRKERQADGDMASLKVSEFQLWTTLREFFYLHFIKSVNNIKILSFQFLAKGKFKSTTGKS